MGIIQVNKGAMVLTLVGLPGSRGFPDSSVGKESACNVGVTEQNFISSDCGGKRNLSLNLKKNKTHFILETIIAN